MEKYWVYWTGIWGGLFASDVANATPKRHWLWSNDETLLQRLSQAAGKMSGECRKNMQGEALVTKYQKKDGSAGFSGSERMKSSQLGPKFHDV